MKDLILKISLKNKLFIIFIFVFFVSYIIINEKIYAHQPYFIKSYSKIENGLGIKISDASISHALYGEFDKKNQFTIIDVDISNSEDLLVQVLIPNKYPENEINIDELPLLQISSNKNDYIEIRPDIRIEFYEPFTKMNLLRIASYNVSAKSNKYSIQLLSRSSSPLRFVQSVGYKEVFFKRYIDGDFEDITVERLNKWYSRETINKSDSNFKLDLLLILNNNLTVFLIILTLVIICVFVGILIIKRKFYNIRKKGFD